MWNNTKIIVELRKHYVYRFIEEVKIVSWGLGWEIEVICAMQDDDLKDHKNWIVFHVECEIHVDQS